MDFFLKRFNFTYNIESFSLALQPERNSKQSMRSNYQVIDSTP